jgi:hypothetical protein
MYEMGLDPELDRGPKSRGCRCAACARSGTARSRYALSSELETPARCQWVAATDADVARDGMAPRYRALLGQRPGFEVIETRNGRLWKLRVISRATDPGLTRFDKDVKGWLCPSGLPQPIPIGVEELRTIARRIELRLSEPELRALQAGGTVSLQTRPLAEFCNTLMMARANYRDGNWPSSPAPVPPAAATRPSGCPRPPCDGVCFVVSRKSGQRAQVVCVCLGFFFVRLCAAFMNP